MKKSAKENIGKVAILSNSPRLKKTLEKYGHKVGDTFLSSQEIASVAVLSALEENGLTLDFVIKVLKGSLGAVSSVVVQSGKDTQEIKEVIDYKARTTAVQTYLDLIGIRKGITVPEVSVDLVKNSPMSISFKGGGSLPKEGDPVVEEVPVVDEEPKI